jgi:hypothetical protein
MTARMARGDRGRLSYGAVLLRSDGSGNDGDRDNDRDEDEKKTRMDRHCDKEQLQRSPGTVLDTRHCPIRFSYFFLAFSSVAK